MRWWEQALSSLSGTLVGGGIALVASNRTRKHEASLESARFAEARRLRDLEHRNEAYRQYFRWLAEQPVDGGIKVPSRSELRAGMPTPDVADGTRRSRGVLADLLLYGSDEVKALVDSVQEAVGLASNKALGEFARAIIDFREGKIDYDVVQLTAMLYAGHFHELVWPKATDLADVMASELKHAP